MIDTRGYSCPTPVLLVQKAVKSGAPAELEVLADAMRGGGEHHPLRPLPRVTAPPSPPTARTTASP